MRKTYEKRVKKDLYIGNIVHYWKYILLIFKDRVFFLLVYIRFLTFTINT